MTVLGTYIDTLKVMQSVRITGSVAAVKGLSVLVDDLPVSVGTMVRMTRRIGSSAHDDSVIGEVIGFDRSRSIVMLFDSMEGVTPGSCVVAEQSAQTVSVGSSLLGRVIDGMARPLDGRPMMTDTVVRPLSPAPTSALRRKTIDEPLPTGVRAIDAMVTIGRGQRVGVFSGPGVGKSTLLASIARNTSADVNVIALIGERGREVREFLSNTLGEEGLKRSVVIVATGDESPLLRVRAALVACTIAEYFRELGNHVMLIMDSITRFAQAQRQIGLTVGEQPATKGYTPSVFALLPAILERAGALEHAGSITGLYAVLVEGDDMTEPISDAVRGILDGHLSLSRRLAGRGHFPAIDLLDSISRVADDVCDQHHIKARRTIKRLLAAYAESEELINIGAYAYSSPDCNRAIKMKDKIDAFLQQESSSSSDYPVTCKRLIELSLEAEADEGLAPGAGMKTSTTKEPRKVI